MEQYRNSNPNPNPNPKRVIDFSDEDASPATKRARAEDLLELLDNDDAAAATSAADSAGNGEHDLASLMRSFEEEISGELGFLFNASDDELGLPPPAGEEAEESPESASPASGREGDVDGGVGDVGGLFLDEYDDLAVSEPSDLADLMWQPMPAL